MWGSREAMGWFDVSHLGQLHIGDLPVLVLAADDQLLDAHVPCTRRLHNLNGVDQHNEHRKKRTTKRWCREHAASSAAGKAIDALSAEV